MKNEIGTGIADEGVISEIYDIIKNHEKTEYAKIIEQRASYPVTYHLAQIRSNVIEWLPMKQTESVLEINAECGALSEVLLKKTDNFTFLTDTKKQKEIVSLRLEKNVKEYAKKKITGYFGNFSDIEPKLLTYDVIVLCGVFGYAQQMLAQKEENAYETLIRVLKRHLKAGGRIVSADANRLGLKYIAGCQDDHFGGYFLGLHNYAGYEGYRTFTKKEYETLFKEAGMNELEFYYPYPDYKFPVAIYSDDYLPKEGELNDNLRNLDRDRYMLFEELPAYNTLISEGLFQEFSNSFLIIARQKGNS